MNMNPNDTKIKEFKPKLLEKPYQLSGGKIFTEAERGKVTDENNIISKIRPVFDFRYNCFSGKIEVKKTTESIYVEMTDRLYFGILNYLRQFSGLRNLSDSRLRGLLISEFVSAHFHPASDYFESLPDWNQDINFIKKLTDLFYLKNENDREFFIDALTRWIVGVVAQSLEIGINQLCLILCGPQGTGKSTFFQNLLPDELKKYFVTDIFSTANKDNISNMIEKIMYFLDEIESSNKNELSQMKSAISAKEFDLRRPFGRFVEKSPRHASFCAAINDPALLTDLTGNRRFLIFEISKIEYKKIATDLVRGIWQQSFSLLSNGYRYWYESSEINTINERNKQFEIVLKESEMFHDVFEILEKWPDTGNPNLKLTTSQIAERIAFYYDIGRNISIRTLGTLLRHEAIRKKDIDTGNVYCYAVREKPKERITAYTSRLIKYDKG